MDVIEFKRTRHNLLRVFHRVFVARNRQMQAMQGQDKAIGYKHQIKHETEVVELGAHLHSNVLMLDIRCLGSRSVSL